MFMATIGSPFANPPRSYLVDIPAPSGLKFRNHMAVVMSESGLSEWMSERSDTRGRGRGVEDDAGQVHSESPRGGTALQHPGLACEIRVGGGLGLGFELG